MIYLNVFKERNICDILTSSFQLFFAFGLEHSKTIERITKTEKIFGIVGLIK